MPLLCRLILELSALALASTAVPDLIWETVGTEDGITVQRAEVPGSKVMAFRGETVIEAPIARVAGVLVDIDRRPQWMPNLGEARILRQVSKWERIEYTHVETPFVIKDRDFVLRARANPGKEHLTFSFESVEDAEMPPTDKVRGRIFESHYRLTPQPDATTHVEFLVHADPRGSVAKWIVNLFQKSFPRKTLEGLRHQAALSDVTEHPEAKRLYPLARTSSARHAPAARQR